ncbi:MAG: hypothetical protein WCI92_19435 [Bacteroidota bacterium]
MSKRNGSCRTPLNINPFRFMELDKPEILYKLTNELSYPEEEAHCEFYSMTGILTLLKTMRYCQSQTDDYLKDTIPYLHPKIKMVTVTILLDATQNDDTYCHAYNTFVYYANRYMRINRPRKFITDHELLILLEAEKTPKAPVFPDQKIVTENPLVFDERLLNAFYLAFDNYIWEHAAHADFMNWFRVNPIGKPVFRDKMTAYFCYAVGKIENRMIESLKPKNLNRWIESVINGNNYSGLKNRRMNKVKTGEIDHKLSLI